MRITRAHVAKAANVSEAVVSFVINNSNYVSEEKRALVLDAIEKLGYEPNYFARALRSNKSKHISVVTSPNFGMLFPDVFFQLQRGAYTEEYSISVLEMQDLSIDFYDKSISRSDGIIVFCDRYTSDNYEWLTNKKKPAVILLTEPPTDEIASKFSTVHINFKNSIDKLFNIISLHGARRIAYLYHNCEGEKFPIQSSGQYRTTLKEAEERGTEIEAVPVDETNAESVFKSLHKWLSHSPFPNVVLAETDNLALYCLGYASSLGLKAGSDFSIIGTGDTRLSSFSNPALSTIGYDTNRIANCLIREVINQISTKKMNNSEIETTLILRQSSIS